ncbi:VOC family protein [Paraglaciecola aquimarina]|uniref:VOC family protein n=1 Tax=Paraglaciecola aquimarina TaxID=1235557 RepID=A0ABU3SVM3_9ALTE|nr:VOC family protein [Paraglaciecola aquimarina]MDU0354049.1 VOC family protein [Paraglaciecola aquimarina]
MHLEHINMVVRDLPETLKFYQAAFPHWKVRGHGEQVWNGFHRTWLHFGDDYHYLTFNDNGTGENRDLSTNQLGLCHFAYAVNEINAVVKRLEVAGFAVAKAGQNTEFRKNSYFIDPNGFEIEFVQYLSDLPKERNNYV